MIINQHLLLKAAPIAGMIDHKVQAVPTSYGLTECGYDIRIAEDIFFDPEFRLAYVDDQSYPCVITNGGYEKGGKHDQGRCVLASSIEVFQMPNHLMGRVLNKSTWARQFVDASLTTNIEPGWRGNLTIELVFSGSKEVRIPAGSGIAQVIFETIAVPAEYVGKYQDQEAGPVEAKTEWQRQQEGFPYG